MMKRLYVFMFCAGGLAAAGDPVSRMVDDKLTIAQRNNACFALRGDRSREVIAAMRGALASDAVRACAARNLREAGAVEELKGALSAPQPEVRAVAARELGALERPDLIELLAKAARDSSMLVATNAVMGLGEYHDRAVVPYLLELAQTSGPAAVAALSQAGRLDEPATLSAARKLLTGSDVAAKLMALMIVGDCGDASDLPRLREIAAKSVPLSSHGRGFGLLPSLNLARAAQNAIQAIEKRQGSVPSPSVL